MAICWLISGEPWPTALRTVLLLQLAGHQIRGYIYVGAMPVAGIVYVATSSVAALGIILIALAVVLTLFLTQMPKHRRTQSARLAGTTKVEFSETGSAYKQRRR
jgi:hypothetical protein